jgi:hypothetical protein
MDGIETQEMSIGLDRAEIVDRHDLDILSTRFDEGPQHVAADAAKSVDRDANWHDGISSMQISDGFRRPL